MTVSDASRDDTRSDEWPLWRRGAVAFALSVILNAIVVAVAVSREVAPGFESLDFGPVLTFTTLGVLGAVVVYAALARVTETPGRAFAIFAGVVLLVSFVPTLVSLSGSEDATPLGIGVLMFMHVVVAAVCVAVLPRDGIV